MKEIDIKNLKENFINLISDEWALVCAGNKDNFNMMTASWGFFGEMWGKHCVVAAIRPSRYTFKFVEKEDYFSLCFLGDDKSAHKICGSMSGREIDKAKETGLSPIFNDSTVYFEQARLIIICRKLYMSEIKPENFFDKDCLKWYNNDFHKMFIAEIIKVYEK